MNLVYKLKENIADKDLTDCGFEIAFINDDVVISKLVKQDLNGPLCQGSLKTIYSTESWKRLIYDKNKEEIIKSIDLRFTKEGRPIMSNGFKEMLTSWFIIIYPNQDRILGFRSGDPFDNRVYCNAKVLQDWCKDELKELIDKGLVEEFIMET